MLKKIIGAVIVIGLAAGAYFAFQFYGAAVKKTDNTHFFIKDMTTISQVKSSLISGGFINGKNFDFAAKMLKYKTVKPGRYKLKEGMSLIELIRLLRSGNQDPVKMVIIKERTKELFAGKFGQGKKYAVATDSLQMITYLNDVDKIKGLGLGVDTSTVMGLVLPYTYSVFWNTSPAGIMEQFTVAYKKFWTDERKRKADSLQLTPIEVITMASIVEEETNKKEDKYKIASVYLNRIKVGMPLQADPTVKFATRDFGLKRILSSHLKVVSPYNTYLNRGLPPGPICTPSPETIDAVLNAPETNYIYFVASSRFDGSSEFTTNYSDHLKVARQYQQELTRRMDSSKKANANK